MSRRVLVTGGSGFVGQWFCRLAMQRGWEAFAGRIDAPHAPAPQILSESEHGNVRWLALDVTSQRDIDGTLQAAQPDLVLHLAGIAFPPSANADPVRTYEINALGAARLLHSLGAAGATGTRVLVVGTAEQYGTHDRDAYPIVESAQLRPISWYAGSKAAQEVIALQAYRTTGVPVICTRSFNHSGVGHAREYLLPSLVARARDIGKGPGTLRIGNGTPVRDYLHVADVVEAYALLLEKGEPGEIYNVSSGQGITVQELAERVLRRANVSGSVVQDPALMRPSDIPVSVGDSSKLRRQTGWRPSRTIDDIIDDLTHAAPR
ncbi:MAG TPA: GDP-mannose 4,6-dehydratase [Gemmatimonadaceae bacterium]|nr:GDP-mannose 4,6-dehydratase [Gemmatimonadaceae bacterium]